jgi:signal transduction histidine kinase
MNGHREQILLKWQGRIGVAPSVYRLLALLIAAGHIFIFRPSHYSMLPPVILFTVVAIYTLFKVLHTYRWQQGGTISFSLVSIDIALCIFLFMSTGGLYSPYLLYTLAPVLTAALFLDEKVTFSIAVSSAAYVILGHIFNPFLATPFSLVELSYLLIYTIAVFLTATLPYLTNINLRQRLQSRDILQERQRLSREIHDGTVQSLSAIRWQIQLLQRSLLDKGLDLGEARQLEVLTQKAYQDARDSLELLRNYNVPNSFLPQLKDNLKQLNQENNIEVHLDVRLGRLDLETPVELELLRICQEAMTNIRKHSRAQNVQVKVGLADGHIEVSIADDGRGFDALAFYRDGIESKGHGLAVMRERAELMGGRFRVVSMPGQGTEVQVEVPIKVSPREGLFLWRK